jgi:branched-chain amino acid transport system permease protein
VAAERAFWTGGMTPPEMRRRPPAVRALLTRHRLRPAEALPWICAIAVYYGFPDYLALGGQILVMVLFVLSLDLVLGYAGIVTLGHAAFFGIVGYVTGLIVLRTRGLTLLMVTLVVAQMLQETANKMGWLTGGADGLQGITIQPVLGLFRFDMFGRTAYLYGLAVLFVGWIVARIIVHSPFGRSLTGIRENLTRMQAIGSPVFRRKLAIYVVSAALAGVAGAVLTQTTQFVGLQVLGFEMSAVVIIMLILGGIGRLYGAFIGAPLYMIAQDQLAKDDPVNWLFWIGLLLLLVVLFARGGILGLVDRFLPGRRPRGDISGTGNG